jgi:hypothetical protein
MDSSARRKILFLDATARYVSDELTSSETKRPVFFAKEQTELVTDLRPGQPEHTQLCP